MIVSSWIGNKPIGPGRVVCVFFNLLFVLLCVLCVYVVSSFVLFDDSLYVVYCIVFSVSCVGRVTNLLALFTLIYPPSLCATLSVHHIFMCACNHV